MTGPRNFLRYAQFVTELGPRPVVIGRAGTCDLVTEDELASREHCRIELDGERVVLTDLESRNGVLVNGTPVSGSQELHHGDVITIGTQQITLMRQHRAPRLTPALGDMRPDRGDDDDDDHEPTRAGDIYEILHGSALIALAGGDVLGADATARNLFVALRATIARTGRVPVDVVPQAFDLALELAETNQEMRWLEQGLDLLTAARELVSRSQANRLAELARHVGTPRRALDEYVRMAEGDARAGQDAAALRTLKLL